MAHVGIMDMRCPDLVGRAVALDTLRQSIDSAPGARAQALFLVGDAGVGKSRLVAEAAAYARTRGIQVLQSNCFPQDRAYPYAPLLALIRAQFTTQPPAVVQAIVAPFAQELGPLLPEWAVDAPDPAHAAMPDPSQRRLLDALAHCLLRQRDSAPALLIVEDMHWCDGASLEALLHLLRAAARPLTVIGSYRGDEIDDAFEQWLALAGRVCRIEELQLTRLSRTQVGEMLAAIFGAQSPLPAALLDPLDQLAEGNPLFVEELLGALVASGTIRQSGTEWTCAPLAEIEVPRSLNEIVQQRLRSLGAPARELLTLAAVIGRSFDFALLQQLAQIDEAELLRRLKELVAAQLVVEEAPDQFAFRHALTRQAIYAGLLARERRTLHGAVADALELLHYGAAEPVLADMAYHYYEAQRWPQALAYAADAGEQAWRLHAPHAAIAHYTRALHAADQLAQPARARNAASLPLAPARTFGARGLAYEMSGQFDAARADYQAAADAAQAAGDQRAVWQALVRLGMLWAGRDYNVAGGYYERALALARTLEAPVLIAHSLNRVGNWHTNAARPLVALRLHQQALALFEREQDPQGIAETLDLLGMTSHLSADRSRSLAYYERAVAAFGKLGNQYGLAAGMVMTMSTRAASYYRDDVATQPGGLEQALRDGESALAHARKLEWRAGESFALWALAMVLGFAGEYGRALHAVYQSREIAEAIAHQQWRAAACWTHGMIALDLLDGPAARASFAQALEDADAIRSTFWLDHARGCLAVAHLLDRRPAQAEALLTTGASQPADDWGARWLIVWARVRLVLARRDPAGALALLNQASPAEADGRGRHDTLRMALTRGQALAALGQATEAETVLRHARDIADQHGARSLLWRCDFALGEALHSQGRFDDAQRAWSAGHTLVEELAATLPDAGLRSAFVQRAAARIPRRYNPSSRRAATARFNGLTAREREVAALVGRGLANREIADALVIGERTVETHVSHIFAKLGAASRHEIAAWAVAQGLVSEP